VNLGAQLHQVARGRIFVRAAAQTSPVGYPAAREFSQVRTPCMVFGVVELPKCVEVERKHMVRLNTSLWMDDVNSARVTSDWLGPQDVAEHDIGNLLTTLKYGVGVIPDTFELFVRSTMMPHASEGKRWAYVAGVVANRLDATPVDGLYEFDKSESGSRLVSDNQYNGEGPSNILREALWGPDGVFGLSTSMEPTSYPAWLAGERARQGRARPGDSSYDPMFLRFAEAMERLAPLPMVYTRAQLEERDNLSKKVMRDLMGPEEPALETGTSKSQQYVFEGFAHLNSRQEYVALTQFSQEPEFVQELWEQVRERAAPLGFSGLVRVLMEEDEGDGPYESDDLDPFKARFEVRLVAAAALGDDYKVTPALSELLSALATGGVARSLAGSVPPAANWTLSRVVEAEPAARAAPRSIRP
jgi:hypothetical protein